MTEWTVTDRRIGAWSAVAIVVFGVLYVITGAAWLFATADSRTWQLLQPTDPFLAILGSPRCRKHFAMH
jgi:uncharacterized membrane protein